MQRDEHLRQVELCAVIVYIVVYRLKQIKGTTNLGKLVQCTVVKLILPAGVKSMELPLLQLALSFKVIRGN